MKKKITFLLMFFTPVVILIFASLCAAESVMVEKNLFSPDRKPPSSEPVTEAPGNKTTGLPPKSVQLDGVFIHGDSKRALLRVRNQLLGEPKSKEPFPYLSVREGDPIGDFRVVKIEPRSVTLSKDGQEFVIGIFAEGKVVPPPPPPPPAIPVPGAEPADQSPQPPQPGVGGKGTTAHRVPGPAGVQGPDGSGRPYGVPPAVGEQPPTGQGVAPQEDINVPEELDQDILDEEPNNP